MFPLRFHPLFQLLDLHCMDRWLIIDLDHYFHRVKYIVFRPKKGVQLVETTDGRLEKRIRLEPCGVLDAKVIDILHDAGSPEHENPRMVS